MALGDSARAEAAFQQALRLSPQSGTAKLNLADLYRATGREAECERLIRDVLRREPEHAAAKHALGLSLLRQRRLVKRYRRYAMLVSSTKAILDSPLCMGSHSTARDSRVTRCGCCRAQPPLTRAMSMC